MLLGVNNIIEELPNIEDKFKDTLFLDPTLLYPELKVDYKLNHIRQFQGIILGRPGSGKTQVANWLANSLMKKYGDENVNAVSSSSLRHLLKAVDDKLINLLFLDDLTMAKTTKEELAQLFRIRHIIEARTGRTNGIVIPLLGLHRYFGCDPSIRSNYDFILFRSAPTNEYDRNWTKRHIGTDATNLLSNIELDRNKELELFNTTIAWLKGTGAGYMDTPLPSTSRMWKATGWGSGYNIPNKNAVYNKLIKAKYRSRCVGLSNLPRE